MKFPWDKHKPLTAMSVSEISRGMDEARMRAEAEFQPPDLAMVQKLVILHRQWFLVYKEPSTSLLPSRTESSDPAFLSLQDRLLPAGLTEGEQRKWYWGGLQESCRAYLRILNTSFSKEELGKRLHEAGLDYALLAFDLGTQQQITDEVIKYLPEGGTANDPKEEAGQACRCA
jgi:hypothetical protein